MTQSLPVPAAPSILAKYTPEEQQVIRDLLPKNLTDPELKFFLLACDRYKLDPIRKQIHAVKRWNDREQREFMTIQVGIDGYRAIAERTGRYAGSDEPVFEGTIKMNHDNSTIDVPAKCTVTVYKMVSGTRCPFTASTRWMEFYPGVKMGFQWRRMPHVMLSKTAEAAALRKAFPEDLGGVYVEEEMHQAANVEFKKADPALKDSLIKLISETKSDEELTQLANTRAADFGKLPPDDQREVREASKKMKAEFAAMKKTQADLKQPVTNGQTTNTQKAPEKPEQKPVEMPKEEFDELVQAIKAHETADGLADLWRDVISKKPKSEAQHDELLSLCKEAKESIVASQKPTAKPRRKSPAAK